MAARRSRMSVGEWLNNIIEPDDDEDDVAPALFTDFYDEPQDEAPRNPPPVERERQRNRTEPRRTRSDRDLEHAEPRREPRDRDFDRAERGPIASMTSRAATTAISIATLLKPTAILTRSIAASTGCRSKSTAYRAVKSALAAKLRRVRCRNSAARRRQPKPTEIHG